MDEILGVLYKVPSGEPVGIPKRHLAIFGVTRDSGKTTFIEAAIVASGLIAITFRTKRGELGFEKAKVLPLFFDERGLLHWKALEGLIAATLEEKVQREPGIRGAIIRVCTRPTKAKSLSEIHLRVKEKLTDSKVRGFEKDVFTKLDAYLDEVLPQLEKLRGRFTDRLELHETGTYVEDLIGLSDELQNLFLASLMRKVYEEFSGVIIPLPEVWKFLPQDKGSPVKWIIEKFAREMGAVDNWLWIDAQDLRGVDKKHLRSIDTRLFGRQPDSHEIEELLKALPLPKHQKPKSEEIMTLKLGHFYAKLKNKVELVYARPTWLPESVAIRVAKQELEPDSEEVQKYNPSRVLEDEDLAYKEKWEKEKTEREKAESKVTKLATEKLQLEDNLKDANKTIEGLDSQVRDMEFMKQDVEEVGNLKAAIIALIRPELERILKGTSPISTQQPQTISMVEIDARINQRLSESKEITVVSVDVDQRVKELVRDSYVGTLEAKIKTLSASALKGALWIRERKSAKVADLYFYIYEKTGSGGRGRIPGSFYRDVVNPLQDAWLCINESGNLRWTLEEKLSAELKDVLRNGDVQPIAQYLTSLLLL